jgi:predicted metal-dependent phosphoesterase TrpH
VVELARRSGLSGLAITDHDTVGAVPAARAAAAGTDLEIIPAVEISTEFHEHDLHLLGYFVDPENPHLAAALRRLRARRKERFWDMVGRLRDCGVSLPAEDLNPQAESTSLGRVHLAQLLVRARRVGSVREAFHRYLGDRGKVTVPKVRLPVQEAIALVRGAGGVASWAHPGARCTRAALAELGGWGLGAVEVEYPACRPARRSDLRALAAALRLGVTGGSDCHGPGHYRREVGACGITVAELEVLRDRAGS